MSQVYSSHPLIINKNKNGSRIQHIPRHAPINMERTTIRLHGQPKHTVRTHRTVRIIMGRRPRPLPGIYSRRTRVLPFGKGNEKHIHLITAAKKNMHGHRKQNCRNGIAFKKYKGPITCLKCTQYIL